MRVRGGPAPFRESHSSPPPSVAKLGAHHTVSKMPSSKTRSTYEKVGIVALLVFGTLITSPILLPAIAIAGAYNLYKKTTLAKECKKMKKEEEKAKLETCKAVFKDLEKELGSIPNDLPLKKEIDALEVTLHAKGDSATVNQQFLQQFRKILSSPEYQAHKEDPEDQGVRILHRLAVALYKEVRVLDQYVELGKAISAGHREGEAPRTGPKIADALKESQRHVADKIHTDHGLVQKLGYLLSHPKQGLGSIAALGGAAQAVADVFGHGEYDPHALQNNPSFQGATVLEKEVKGQAESSLVTIDNVYGGSPTVGDQISPEFLAVLDAIQTNKKRKDRDPKIPDTLLYTNFQNISAKEGEGARSRAIMGLNSLYSDVFTGITLPKDSRFYKGAEDQSKGFDAIEFGNKMLGKMLSDTSFDSELHRHPKTDGGFYFPGGKEAWKTPLRDIIDKAQIHFVEKAGDPKELRLAFQEYVYTMIQAYAEARSTQGDVSNVMAIRACKENIDRGGVENVKYLYTRFEGESKERWELMEGMFHARAIAVRDRVILDKRAQALYAFCKHVELDAFRKEQTEMLLKLGIVRSTYKPATGKQIPISAE